jgi:hypothetical protein
LTMNGDRVGETKLRIAFPHKRKLVDHLAQLAESLPRQRSRKGGGPKNQSRTNYAGTTHAPRQEYLLAARRAIDQLGENAERSDLLNCAAKLLESVCQSHVDIP